MARIQCLIISWLLINRVLINRVDSQKLSFFNRQRTLYLSMRLHLIKLSKLSLLNNYCLFLYTLFHIQIHTQSVPNFDILGVMAYV